MNCVEIAVKLGTLMLDSTKLSIYVVLFLSRCVAFSEITVQYSSLLV